MSAGLPISFVHQLVHRNHALTESVCPKCGEFVAASADRKNLLIAEAAHVYACQSMAYDIEVKAVSLPTHDF
jgi:hypothetical protein